MTFRARIKILLLLKKVIDTGSSSSIMKRIKETWEHPPSDLQEGSLSSYHSIT